MSHGGSVLPPDIREQMEKSNQRKPETSVGGIGGRSQENASTAHQRNVAMGREEQDESLVNPNVPIKAKEEPIATCANVLCNSDLEIGWTFCPKCGGDVSKPDAAKQIGIEIGDADLQDYLFKGYVVKDLKLLGSHTVTLRSSQAKDLKEIDDLIVNGDWLKDGKGNERQVSDYMLRQMNALCLTAMSVQKVDNKSIGESLEDRVAWLEERGSAFVDMLAERVRLFNISITEYIKKEDSILGF